MTIVRVTIIIIISFSFIFSCAKKKEEAQQLEKELVGESLEDTYQQIDSAEIDSIVVEPVEQKVTMPPRPKGVGYTVQIAATVDEAYAESLVELYRNRGYEPFVITEDVNGVNYYRVRIGMFYSLDDAKLVQQELSDKYSVDGWIDHVR